MKNVWPLISENEELMEYFPDMTESQLPEKKFLFRVLATLNPEALRELIAQCIKNRSPNEQDDNSGMIEVSAELKSAVENMFSMNSIRF